MGFLSDLRTLPSTTGDYRNNTYHGTQFRLPKLNEGDRVVLQADDVINQVLFEFDTYITQGGCMDDGIIYYAFGYGGKSGNTASKIRIYNTDNGMVEEKMNLKGVIVEELEDIAFYGDDLLLNTSSNTIYKIKRK